MLERGRQTVSGISGGHSHVLARGLEAFLALKPREFKEILTYRIYGKAFEQLKVELALFFFTFLLNLWGHFDFSASLCPCSHTGIATESLTFQA